MKIFGRVGKGQPAQEPERQPRLEGHTEPYYSDGAKRVFVNVLTAAADAQRPGRIGANHDSVLDRTARLDEAVAIAGLLCNAELIDRLSAFRDAVIEWTMTEENADELAEARSHFTEGCRIALGTND